MANNNDRSDWERKQTQDAYYASIPYGLRQQMQFFNSGGQESPKQYEMTQKNVDDQAPALPSLTLVSPLSDH